LPSDNGRLLAKCRGSVAEISGNSRVPGPKKEAGAQTKDGVQRRDEGMRCWAQQGEKGPGEGRRTWHNVCFEGPENNADAKETPDGPRDRSALWGGLAEARSVGAPPSSLISSSHPLAPNARALFRFKLSVVEMKMRLVDDRERRE